MHKRVTTNHITTLSICCILIIATIFTTPKLVNASNNQSIKEESVLLKKVSKDFTNKFCNGIGFGLSKESAITFALKENKQAFEKRKGIGLLNQEEIAEQVAISVIDKCGYPIGLKGQEGTEEFKVFYLENENKVNS